MTPEGLIKNCKRERFIIRCVQFIFVFITVALLFAIVRPQ